MDSKSLPAFERIRYKLRYNSWPRLLVNGLKRFGIVVLPYYLFRRSLNLPAQAVERGDWELLELGADEMPRLAALPLVHGDEKSYRDRIQKGQRAFALCRGGEVGAFCWMDPVRCSYAGEGFQLQDDEIYLYDIFTALELRGMNLAPLLSSLYSKQLHQEGYRHVYSVVDAWNKPSLNYIRKIGARAERKNLYINLFGIFKRSIVLRRF